MLPTSHVSVPWCRITRTDLPTETERVEAVYAAGAGLVADARRLLDFTVRLRTTGR